MGPSLTPKTATPQIETGLYTEAFAAILAERNAPEAISAPVEVRRTMPGRQSPFSYNWYDWRHVAALGWLLLLSIGATSWYAIVDPIWRTPIIISSPDTTSLHILPTSMPSLFIESGTLLIDAVRAGAAADEGAFAAIDPIFSKFADMGVETAVLSTPATVAPSQTTDRPAPDLIASLVETNPNAPTSSHRLPKDTIGVRPGNDLKKLVTIRNGEVKGTIENPFVDLHPEKPHSGWPNISTASSAGSHAASQGPHPNDGAPGGSTQGKKDSKIDKPAPGGNATAEGKGPKAGKEKPSTGKGAPAGHQDSHHSNSSGPSPGKADQNEKSDADNKDKGKGGKDKGDKAKGPK